MVEHNLAKVGVASSSLVFRSLFDSIQLSFFVFKCHSGHSEDLAYGWEYLKYRIWNYNIVGEIIAGDVFAEIKRRFEDILTEIEERCLRMP